MAIDPLSMPEGFSLVSNLSETPLATGETTSFEVRLNATDMGNFSGSVSFDNGDADENPFNFAITGVVSNVLVLDDSNSSVFSATAGWSNTWAPPTSN